MTFKIKQSEVEDLMKSVVRILLDIPATDGKSVRIPYGASSKTGSAPSHNPESSVCYIYVEPTDDGYGEQHHKNYIDSAANDGSMTEVDEYTEEYAVIFSCYGQDAYDRARIIRDGLYSTAVKRIFDADKMYLKPGMPPLAQTHEVINTQWVKRCDVTATFYAYTRVEYESALQSIEQVSITLSVSNKSLSYGE